ncbi:hypothetical protein KY285_014152 [Solanum tuberosum]|nr:hypothetical protein KY285_014152 [Solanum tuberosum]
MGVQHNPTPTTRTQGLLPTANAHPIELINSAHPFFISHSDSLGTLLVNTVFDGKGFGGWKRGIWITLTAKNKSEFIDGSTKEPECIYYSTAKGIWEELEDMFGQSSGPRLFQLQKELSDLVQGSSDIPGYYTKIKRLWDELDTLDTFSFCPYDCTCGTKEKNIKAKQDKRLVQFLMGLNDSYCALIEKQREVQNTPKFPRESSSFVVANQANVGPRQKTSQSSVQGNAVTSNDVFGDSFMSDTVSTDQAKLLTAEQLAQFYAGPFNEEANAHW